MKKQKCIKERLPRPNFGVLRVSLGPAGGPGGSPKCKKEASGGYQKKAWKKRVAPHAFSIAKVLKKAIHL